MKASFAIERAGEADSVWFERHRGARERLRLALPGEFDFVGSTVVPPPGTWARVVQVALCVRSREWLGWLAAPSEGSPT
jgi:hypothetical protein